MFGLVVPLTLALSWNAPEGCPTREAVQQEVLALLGGRPPNELQVNVDVSKQSDGSWEASLTSSAEPTPRKLTGQTCATVAKAAGVVIALMVDPASNTAPAVGKQPIPTAVDPPPPAPAPERPAPARRAQTRPAPATPAPAPDDPGTFFMGAHIAGNVNALPTIAAFGFGAYTGGIMGPIRIDLGFTIYPSVEVGYDAAPEVVMDVDLIAAHVALAYMLVSDPLELGPQLGIKLGSMSAQSFGVTEPGSDASAWIEPYLAVQGAIRVAAWFAVPFRAGLGWAAIRPKFSVPPLGVAWEVDGFVGEFAAGPEFRF